MTFQIDAVFHAGALHPVVPLVLPEGTQVRIAVEADQGVDVSNGKDPAMLAAVKDSGSIEASIESTTKPIWEVFAEAAASLPQEIVDQLPVDGAGRHDEYIYGAQPEPR